MGKSKNKSTIREWLEAIILGLFLIVGVRAFLFDLVVIPTTSMEKTVLAGDFVLINKIDYGPRIPPTPLSLPFSKQGKYFSSAIQLPYFRIPGTGKISHNDIVLFNYPLETFLPLDHRTYFIKRCIGLPGDIVEIINMELLVNGKNIPDPENLQFDFNVQSKTAEIDPKIFKELNITEGGMISKDGWQFSMTSKAAETLKNHGGIKSVTPVKDEKQLYLDHIFPHHTNYLWSRDNYGPVYIPKAGDSVKITLGNLPLYEQIITEYESNALEFNSGGFLLNGEPLDYYTFRLNYYFMLGDNRHNSGDSRFWGFVPEDHIVGKGSRILFSLDKSKAEVLKKIRWERIMKLIN